MFMKVLVHYIVFSPPLRIISWKPTCFQTSESYFSKSSLFFVTLVMFSIVAVGAVKTNMTDKLCWKRNFTYCCMQEAPRTLRGFISASPSPVFNFLSSFPQFHILQYWQKKMHSFGFHGNSNNSFLLMSQFLLLSCACGITDTLGQRPPLCFVLAEGNPQQCHLLPRWPEKLTNFNTKY